MANELKNKVEGWKKIREYLHQHPEVSGKEENTSQYIKNILLALGVELIPTSVSNAVVGIIRGNEAGKTVALRADIDALPVCEQTGVEFLSQNEGVMHACGHDIHTTVLLSVAEVLVERKKELNGNVKLIFQPEEEGKGGALPLLKEGIFKNPDVSACFGLHVWPGVPVGRIALKEGAVMAAPDEFDAIIYGKGGHGAMPHLCIDPILIGAKAIEALQSIASRRVDPFAPVVVTVGSFHAGTAYNIIPASATLQGTVRTLDPVLRKSVAELVEQTLRGVVQSMEGELDFQYHFRYPPTINDKQLTHMVARVCEEEFGTEAVEWFENASMAGEDFSYYANEVSGVFFRLGCTGENPLSHYPLHHPQFLPDDGCIEVGVKTMVGAVLSFLNNQI